MEEGWERLLPAVKMFAWWSGGALLLLGLSFLGWLTFIRSPLERGLMGLYGMTQQTLTVLGTPLKTISYWQHGVTRMADLEQRLAKMAVERSAYQNLVTENQQLKGSLGLLPTTTATKRLTGRLIDGTETGLVNLGSEAGLNVGDMVVTTERVLVGRIVKVDRYVSRVIRPQDSNAQIAVRIVGKTTTGVMAGDGQVAWLEGVLQADSLDPGDLIVTSGADELYPEGLVVGEVTTVTGEAAEVTKGAQVMLLNKHGTVVYVEVRK